MIPRCASSVALALAIGAGSALAGGGGFDCSEGPAFHDCTARAQHSHEAWLRCQEANDEIQDEWIESCGGFEQQQALPPQFALPPNAPVAPQQVVIHENGGSSDLIGIAAIIGALGSLLGGLAVWRQRHKS